MAVPEIRLNGFEGEWSTKLLANHANFSKGSGYSKDDLQSSGERILLYGSLYTNYRTEISFVDTFVTAKPGSVYSAGNEVVVPASGESAEDIVRASAVVSRGIILGGDLNIIRPNKEIDQLFLALVISSGKQKELAKRAQGNTIAHLRNSDLRELCLVLPSIDEQRAIGDFCGKLDTLLEGQQTRLTQLRRLKDVMLAKMFPRAGESVPEIRFDGFEGEWGESTFGEMATVKSGARVHRNEWRTSGIPFLRASDITAKISGTVNEKAYISEEHYARLIAKSGRLEKGDVLVTGGGSIGLPYLVDDHSPIYSKDADVLWIKKSDSLDSVFVYTSFLAPSMRSRIAGISHVGTIGHYTIEQAKGTLLTYPSLDEQRAIGSFFGKLDQLIELELAKLTKSQQLKASFLNKMII